jgi:hypothetical protein
MTQSAVEYLVEQLERIGFSTNNIVEFENEVQISKEMEKEQQGYNDEEVKHIVSEALQSALATVDLDQFLQQFKKKIRWKLNS